MFGNEVAARWLGLLPALGVLVALLVWYAVRNTHGPARRIITVWGSVHFLVAASSATAVAYFVGLVAASPEGRGLFGGGEGRAWLSIVLALAGLGAGLFVVSMPDAPVVPSPHEPTDDSGDVPSPVEPARPVVAVRAALAAVVGMALPVVGSFSSASLTGGHENGWSDAALVLGGLVVGAAVLYVVLVAEVTWAPVAFLLVAATTGLARAYPAVFYEQFWFMFSAGLSTGLLVPSALRLLRHRVADDRDSLVRGVLLALLVLAVMAGLSAKGSSVG
jgi:hypothetical protein